MPMKQKLNHTKYLNINAAASKLHIYQGRQPWFIGSANAWVKLELFPLVPVHLPTTLSKFELRHFQRYYYSNNIFSMQLPMQVLIQFKLRIADDCNMFSKQIFRFGFNAKNNQMFGQMYINEEMSQSGSKY